MVSVLLINSCASPYAPPRKELCVIGESDAQCNDPRKRYREQDYTKALPELQGYVCTSLNDFDRLVTWSELMVERLDRCESR